jgi:hypothetical protein
MKGLVYKDSPRSLSHLKETITNFIRNIPRAGLACAFTNNGVFGERLNFKGHLATMVA